MSSSDIPASINADRSPRRQTARGLRHARERAYLLMLLPAAILIVVLIGYPILTMIHLAFQDVKLVNVNAAVAPEYTLRNFQRLLTDRRLPQTFQITAIFVFGSTALAFLWGLATALLLDRAFPGRTAIRMLIVSPWAVAAVVASLAWMFLLNSESGLMNYMLLAAGIIDKPINFLGSSIWALPTVVFVSAWKSYPFFTVMLMAGLKAVPKDALDAAKIDGAGPLVRFFWVTLPALRPVIAVSLPLSLLSAFREIETILVLTGGGPGRATETLALGIYNRAFQYFEVGRASALGVVVFLLCFVLVVGTLWLIQDRKRAQ
ncbi:sugar ABC transporter permease [Falsochrobactrum shanghaiense]|uniref:Sugar ABC transporter permease n=1 Tax=Falsochrobactrum shanghaiense TaxID=2201899 RepID=A0A316J8L7_9HYPH|nr:sugar ABC transporter permease [Falsochrobactrum shanghaiense]PWL18302.1 sugar ABC transporter permease [Falsochrobactrum shanghaiense]